MSLSYVQFKEPISVGGNYASITAWSRDKHGKDIELVEKGNWIVLTLQSGQRRRVPMSNVSFIGEDGDPSKEKL